MKKDPHVRFLEMLGWEGAELEEFLPLWRNAAEFLSLSDEDVEAAVTKWLPEYWDLSLKGVRMLINACIREVVELSRSKEYMDAGEPVMYINIPSTPVCINANKLAGKGKLHIAYSGYIMVLVLGAFFNKDSTAYGSCLNNHCANCKMNFIRANACYSGALPPPTITWNWGIKCSEAPKTDELLACLYGEQWKDVFITIPHNSRLGEIEADNEDRVAYLAEKLREAQKKVSRATGIEVREEHLRASLDEYMRYMQKLEELADLVLTADPQPISGSELMLFGIFADMCFEIGYEYVIEAMEIMIAEAKERIAAGRGILPAGSPKVSCQFNPLYAPWLEKEFRNNGVCLTQGRVFPASSMYGSYSDEDIYMLSARMSLAIPSAMNMMDEARIHQMILERYPTDGALYGFYSFDKWVGANQKTMIREIEKKTGIPHFYVEGDLWDSGKSSAKERSALIRSVCNCLKISNYKVRKN